LLELLVVLAILGLLVGLVAPAALRQLGSAKEKIAHQSIERLATVLDACVDLWTARRIAARAVARLPEVPEWNEDGLRMEFVR